MGTDAIDIPDEIRNDPWGGANPDEPDFRDTLYERYRRLRAFAPVHRTPRGSYRLTRYDDCVALLKRTAVGVRSTAGILPFADESKFPRGFMLDQDPPNHTRLRALVRHAFTPKALSGLTSTIDATADQLLDAMEGESEVDLVKALAVPLPSAIICEMLGVPLDDRERFFGWTTDMTYFILGMLATPEQRERSTAAMTALRDYMTDLIEQRRANLSDDLLSIMIDAEEDGDRLTTNELLWQSTGLLVAGFETTTGLIANGVRQLLLHPEQLERLRADPSLIDSAVDECLRFDGPIVGTVRMLHEEAEFGGQTLSENSFVLAVLCAANRDPEQFDDPESFDIGRSPNRHLAFGGGIHTCLGAHLANLEGRAAIGKLIERFPSMQLVSDDVEWSRSLFRIPASLRVRL